MFGWSRQAKTFLNRCRINLTLKKEFEVEVNHLLFQMRVNSWIFKRVEARGDVERKFGRVPRMIGEFSRMIGGT